MELTQIANQLKEELGQIDQAIQDTQSQIQSLNKNVGDLVARRNYTHGKLDAILGVINDTKAQFNNENENHKDLAPIDME